MRKLPLTLALLSLLSVGLFAQNAQAWGVRIGIGVPLYVGPGPYYGYYGYPYGYPYYAPAYAAPPAVVYQTAPTVIAAPAPTPVTTRSSPGVEEVPPPVTTQPQPTSAAPAPLPSVSTTNPSPIVMPILHESTGEVSVLVQKLSDASETVRRDAALDLGRMKAESAIDALANTLKKDSSPVARDGAARALGLIASPRSLNALIYSAQADNDREVRHSAQFAVEVIRTKLRGQ